MKNRIRATVFLAVALTLTWGIAFRGSSEALIYDNSRANVDSGGGQANGAVDNAYSASQDGRYVAFTSSAINLVSGDTNNRGDVFVRDSVSNVTTRVSVSTSGAEGNDTSINPKITPNGRYVSFISGATNLTNPGGVSGKYDLFIRDMQANTTELLYLTNTNSLLNDSIGHYAISADARYIAFTTDATNVVSGDANGATDVFVKDRKLGTTALLSKSDSGVIGNSYSIGTVSISCDGALVAFSSNATNLTASDTNGKADVFLVNRVGGQVIENVTMAGNQGSSQPSVSCDGSKVAFTSSATNLVSSDTNAKYDIFVRDTIKDITQKITMRNTSTQTTGNSHYSYISNDGSAVLFLSADAGLVPGDTNGAEDLFVTKTGLEGCSI